MNVLITGAAGHIGSYLVDNFYRIKKVKKVFFVDNFCSQRFNIFFKLKKKNYFFLYRDLRNKNSLKDIKNIDLIIHLASMTNSEESLKLKNFYKKNNIKCFLNVLNYCLKNKSKLIHISSTSIYDENSKNIEENIKNLKPKSPYSKIKLYEEKTLIKNNDRIKYTSLRFGTIVGVSRGMRFHTAVNKFCFNTIMRIPLPVWSTAFNQYRPYLSIKDAFKTIKFIIEKDFFKNDSFNILTNNYRVKDIIDLIKQSNFNPLIKKVKTKIMSLNSFHVSRKKIASSGLQLSSSIKNDIKDLLLLFKYKK
jgi:UDP-glucose 4-epimerase